MFQLHTERLRLIALSHDQLVLLTKGRNELEKAIGLNLSNFELNADESFLSEFEHAISEYVINWVKENPSSYEWFTHWLIVDIANNLVVGGIGTAGLPDDNGQTIIGYFIDKKSEGKGFASEAVVSFTNWMKKNPAFKYAVADTPLTNIGSQKVLQNAGFVLEGEVEEGLRWRLSR